jgi:hypothetical protein
MTTIEEQIKQFVDTRFETSTAAVFYFPKLKIRDMVEEPVYRFVKTSHTNNLILVYLELDIVVVSHSYANNLEGLPSFCKIIKEGLETIEIVDMTEILERTKLILSNIEFDKLNGRIICKCDDRESSSLDSEIMAFLTKDCDVIKSVYDECCICKEPTYSKTPCCKKELCVPCLIQIKPVREEDYIVPCPLCRRDLTITED